MQGCIRERLMRRAPGIKAIISDVDGVHTPQGNVRIFDRTDAGCPALELAVERDGQTDCIRLKPCDKHGELLEHKVMYQAAYASGPIWEGYEFDTRDGRVIESAIKAGYPVYMISGRNSPCVAKRARDLGAIPLLGAKDKVAVIEQEIGADWSEYLVIGDGFQDIGALKRAAISICPSDSDRRVLALENVWITVAKGGQGVLYESVGAFLEFLDIRLT